MSPGDQAVVGIDVGGQRKGFHAVALRDGIFKKTASVEHAEIVGWCLELKAEVVAVDAPCGWSQSTSSRCAERDLKVAGHKIHCFATPTHSQAQAHTKHFYDWVFNGEKLYE